MSKKIFVKTLLTTSAVGALGGGIASSIALTSCATKTKDKPSLQLTLLSDVSRPIDTDMLVRFSYETSITVKFDYNNLKLVGDEFTGFDFDHSTKTCWVTLPTAAGLGNHSFYLQYDNIKSNPLTVGFSNIEKSLEINASQTITPNGVELPISGSYEAFNIESPTIELVDSDSSIFTPLDVDYYKGTFTTSLPANTPIGNYDLQLVANSDDIIVLSNSISFTVAPFAASDGSNWSGCTSGTVQVVPNEEDMTATITGNTDYVANDLVIPEYVLDNGKFYKVTSIADDAFKDWDSTSILTGSLTIGNSVESIGNNAFQDCSGFTGNLIIPNSVRIIGDSAFWNCSGFTGSLTIGTNVENIGNSAFSGCSGFIGNLTIPNSVRTIGNGAFDYCRNLTGLTISDGVESIGNYAFEGCNKFTGNLTIPDSVTSIGNVAFVECYGFTGSLTIPSSVASIGNGAFDGCNKFDNIKLDGFDAEPSWEGSQIFRRWGDVGTVSISSGEYEADTALAYLKIKGLGSDWTVAS